MLYKITLSHSGERQIEYIIHTFWGINVFFTHRKMIPPAKQEENPSCHRIGRSIGMQSRDWLAAYSHEPH